VMTPEQMRTEGNLEPISKLTAWRIAAEQCERLDELQQVLQQLLTHRASGSGVQDPMQEEISIPTRLEARIAELTRSRDEWRRLCQRASAIIPAASPWQTSDRAMMSKEEGGE